MAESMQTLIDWTLDRGEFRNQIDRMIKKARQLGKVLPLPLDVESGSQAIALETFLISSIICDGCDARCCTRGVDSVIELLPPEREWVEKNHPHALKEGKLPMPCPFLKNHRCEIYNHRPLVCAFYPWQPGGEDGEGHNLFSVSSFCPEARRLVRRVFMASWELRQAYGRLGGEFFEKAFSGLVLGKD